VSFVVTVPDKESVATRPPKEEISREIPDIVESAVKLFEGKIVRKL